MTDVKIPGASSFRIMARFYMEATLIAVILAWCAINGFWILTHAW